MTVLLTVLKLATLEALVVPQLALFLPLVATTLVISTATAMTGFLANPSLLASAPFWPPAVFLPSHFVSAPCKVLTAATEPSCAFSSLALPTIPCSRDSRRAKVSSRLMLSPFWSSFLQKLSGLQSPEQLGQDHLAGVAGLLVTASLGAHHGQPHQSDFPHSLAASSLMDSPLCCPMFDSSTLCDSFFRSPITDFLISSINTAMSSSSPKPALNNPKVVAPERRTVWKSSSFFALSASF